MNIFLIEGSSGEGDGRCDWIVSAHKNREVAETKLKSLLEVIERIDRIKFESPLELHSYLHAYSQDQSLSYEPGNTFYTLTELELED